MKTLYIVRHAKSAWDQIALDDHERPITEKGKKRTKKVIEYLVEKKVTVDLIISSDAVRAKDTAMIIAKGLSYPIRNIQLSSSVYNSDLQTLMNYFYDLSKDVESLMMVGHNPTFTSFANFFLDKKIDWLPTSGIVCIEFETEQWENVLNAEKRTKFVVSPKIIKARKKGNKN
jgi:phosphohistidine phosphatase